MLTLVLLVLCVRKRYKAISCLLLVGTCHQIAFYISFFPQLHKLADVLPILRCFLLCIFAVAAGIYVLHKGKML